MFPLSFVEPLKFLSDKQQDGGQKGAKKEARDKTSKLDLGSGVSQSARSLPAQGTAG